ncbi:MAG: S8 family serine peptidase [Chromatiaceae bacterium]|nr:S8 family serine peptidase [Chromatiaceae bacterium]
MRTAYPEFDGTNTAIVFIDSGWSNGYDPGKLVFDYDFADDDPSAFNPEYKTHGAAVATAASASAKDANIIHLKVFSDGVDGYLDPHDGEDALQWVIDHAASYQIAAVNISFGYGSTTQPSDILVSDEITTLYEMGVITTVAAGNLGSFGVNTIAASANAVGVGAVDAEAERTAFSQYHPTLVDLYALGEAVPIDDASGRTDLLSGTSIASPLVAGAYASLQEASLALTGQPTTVDAFLQLARETGTEVKGMPGTAILDTDALITRFVAGAVPPRPASIAFDEHFYLQANPEVFDAVAAGTMPSARWHYEQFGWLEQRDPSPLLDSAYYLNNNPDVAAAGIDPLTHYNAWGYDEGRYPASVYESTLLL